VFWLLQPTQNWEAATARIIDSLFLLAQPGPHIASPRIEEIQRTTTRLLQACLAMLGAYTHSKNQQKNSQQ